MTTLAELKRTLKVGTTLTMIASFDNYDGGNANKFIGIARPINKVQTNAVRFEGGSWLEYEKASNYIFNGDTFTVSNTLGSLTYNIEM